MPVGDFPDVLDGMDGGTCDVGLISTDSWDMIGASSETHCQSKTIIDVTLYTLSNAIPINDDLARPLQWAIDKAISSGTWALQKGVAQDLFLPIEPAVCAFSGASVGTASNTIRRRRANVLNEEGGTAVRPPQRRQLKGSKARAAASSAASGDGSFQQLDIKGAAGPFIIGALMTTLSLFIWIIERIWFLINDPSRAKQFTAARNMFMNWARSSTIARHANVDASDSPTVSRAAPSTMEVPSPQTKIVLRAADVDVQPDEG